MAGLGALKISHVFLITAHSFSGKDPLTLHIYICSQYKIIFSGKHSLKIQIWLTCRQMPQTVNIFCVVGPLLFRGRIAVIESGKRRSKTVVIFEFSQICFQGRSPVVMVKSCGTGQSLTCPYYHCISSCDQTGKGFYVLVAILLHAPGFPLSLLSLHPVTPKQCLL